MSETVHTAIALALVSGVAMAVIGVVFARGALEIMGTPDDVIAKSTLYMRIYFCGMPFFMMYNYGAAILRAVGDTKRPLIFLIVSGVINAVLNLFLVIGFHLDVAASGLRPLYPSWYPVSWYSGACITQRAAISFTLQSFGSDPCI